MNLHHLAIFSAVANYGSLSAASKQLHVSQPAISRQLKGFEARLGVVLFERLPRGVRLTPAGEALRDYAARLFDVERAATSAMHDIAKVKRGRLNIGASNTIGTYLLPVWLSRFRLLHPQISVFLFVGNTQQVSEGVHDLQFDYGFIEGPLHVPDLRVERLIDDEIVPVVATDHALARKRMWDLRKIGSLPLLIREEGSGTKELVLEMLEHHHIAATDVMTLGNTEALKQAALQGAGIAWLPRLCMTRELADGKLRILKIPKLIIRRPLSLVRTDTKYVSPAGQSFLKLLTKIIDEL